MHFGKAKARIEKLLSINTINVIGNQWVHSEFFLMQCRADDCKKHSSVIMSSLVGCLSATNFTASPADQVPQTR